MNGIAPEGFRDLGVATSDRGRLMAQIGLDDSLDGLSRVFGHFLAKSLEVVLVIDVVMAFVTALLIIIV